MHKTYITFGQDHYHEIGGKVFDRNCVAVIESGSPEEGRELAFKVFGRKFCFEYPEKYFDLKIMNDYYHRGLIPLDTKEI